MTSIHNYKVQINPENIEKAIANYQSKAPYPVTAGMEMERFIIKNEDKQLPDSKLHNAFYKALHAVLDDKTSVEPGAHMIEIKTGVHKSSKTLTKEMIDNISALKDVARKHNITVLDTSDIPHISINEIKRNLISEKDPITNTTRRTPAIIKAYEDQGFNAMVSYGMNTVSTQFTHSVNNADQIHSWAKIHSAFMPLYYAVFENRNRNEHGWHGAMSARKNMGDRCLITDYIFEAKDGNDFAEKYIDFVTNSPIYLVLDENGEDKILNAPTTFNNLPKSQQTLGNFLQAASFNWGVCKIKTIFDEDKIQQGEFELSNMLLEVRDFDVSDDSIPVIANWLYSLVSNEYNIFEVETRFEEIGMPIVSDPIAAKQMIRECLDNVGSASNMFLDAPFGNKGKTLRDVINEVIIPISYETGADAKTIKSWKDIASSKNSPFNHSANKNVTNNNIFKINQVAFA